KQKINLGITNSRITLHTHDLAHISRIGNQRKIGNLGEKREKTPPSVLKGERRPFIGRLSPTSVLPSLPLTGWASGKIHRNFSPKLHPNSQRRKRAGPDGYLYVHRKFQNESRTIFRFCIELFSDSA